MKSTTWSWRREPKPGATAPVGVFPGADLASTDALPPRCDRDGGPWRLDETGVRCATCPRRYVIASVIRRTLRIAIA